VGEIFHTIEDSFAHNLRYFAEKNGKKVLKIGAVLNMETRYYDKFSHDNNFPDQLTYGQDGCVICPTYDECIEESNSFGMQKKLMTGDLL